MARKKGTDTDLCIGQLTKDGLTPRCIAEPKFQVGRSIHWAPDGKTIIAFGVRQLGEFGMFRWRSKKPFSPDPKDWGSGKLVTDTSKANEGVLDAAWSPDGTQARAGLQPGRRAVPALPRQEGRLPADRAPSRPRCARARSRGAATARRSWSCRPTRAARSPSARSSRFSAKNPKDDQTEVGFNGDNPVFQPLTLGP